MCAPPLLTAEAIVSIYLEQRENIPIVLHHFLGQPYRRLFTKQEFNQILFLFTPSSGDSCSPEGPVLGEPGVSRQSTLVQQFLCVPSSGAAPGLEG